MSDNKEQVETFFTQSKSTFPIPTSDGKIELDGFLTASSHLAQFFGILGTVFTPVESDISGNVKKLQVYAAQSKEKINHVNDIVVLEANVPDSVAVDALLWLKRALEFTMAFLDKIISTTKTGEIEEDLRPICLLSYEETLKPYHGWIAQQIFSLVSRACPWRKDLLSSLALGKNDCESIVLEQMEAVLVNLKLDLEIINQLFTTYNLHSDAKV